MISTLKGLFVRYLLYYKYNIKVNSMLVSYHARIGKNSTIMEGAEIDNKTSIGKYCYIGKYCAFSKVKMGNYCSIANNVTIGPGEHDPSRVSTSSLFYEHAYDELTRKDCVIGSDVWIGVDAVILRGVRIGDGAVIGANSVVTNDIPGFTIVAGSPAKAIRSRFKKDKENKIRLSKWWEYDLDRAMKIIKGLENDA